MFSTSIRTVLLIILSLLALNQSITAQELVKDINTSKIGSNPQRFKAGTSAFVFKANSQEYGTELFKSDGTAAGTSVLLDYTPGLPGSNLLYYNVIDNMVYAAILTGTGDLKIVKTNISDNVTEELATIPTGFSSFGTDENGFYKVGDYVYFFIRNNSSWFELWKTDGTAPNTAIVASLSLNSFPGSVQVAGNLLFFLNDDGVHGRELWRSDGTNGGTFLVKDIDVNNTSVGIFQMTSFNGKVYFAASMDLFNYRLWMSDGTEAGTKQLLGADGAEIISPDGLTQSGNLLFFSAADFNNGAELWKTDGTQNGTVLIKDINPGTMSSLPHFFRASEGKVFFWASDGIHGEELWVSNGTAAETHLVKDINPGVSNAFNNSSIYSGATASGMFYFTAMETVAGAELWKTDGTESGTSLVKDIYPGVANSNITEITAFDEQVYFAATDQINGTELFGSDGTPVNTGLVKALNPSGAGSSPIGFVTFKDRLFFIAKDETHGFEAWSSDGTASGTTLLKDVFPDAGNGQPFFQDTLNNLLFFTAQHPEYGIEVWKTDGTPDGTEILKDIFPGTGSISVQHIVGLDNHIVFTGYLPQYGAEPWTSDGTEAGTMLLQDIDPNGQSFANFLRHSFVLNGQKVALFEASNSASGTGLWKTDGTPSGTEFLHNFSGPSTFSVYNALQLGNEVFFRAGSPDNELWKTDGTPTGTVLVKDIYPGIFESGNPSSMTLFKGKIWFTATDAQAGRELWVSDGTASGTQLVKDINPNGDSYIGDLFNLNDELLLFTADSGNYDNTELWVTDGTSQGTHLVKDIYSGEFNSSYPRDFVAFQNELYFSADDGIHGRELWKSNGTEAGTTLVSDLTPGILSGYPEGMIVYHNHIYFSASNGILGQELWRYPAGNSAVNDGPETSNIRLYPNPVNDQLTIQFPTNDNYQLRVIDPAGQVRIEKITRETTEILSTTALTSGIYYLQLTNLKTGQIQTSSFIVAH